MRSDIELQSVPRYRSFNTRCIYGEVHIVRLGARSQANKESIESVAKIRKGKGWVPRILDEVEISIST